MGTVLTINCGSSSVKAALFAGGEPARFKVGGVGEPGRPADHAAALREVFDWLAARPEGEPAAVGHRVVHGGPRYADPAPVTGELLDELRRLIPYDPLHLKPEIEGIERVAELRPGLPQFACFDTAFHRSLPEAASVLALPGRVREAGLRRYGFHGLSYESVVGRLGPAEAAGRVVVAHLGSGASMAAVLGGRCVDTTMGFTPLGGLVMGTRPGDLDPGVIAYLVREEGLDADDLEQLLNFESGLLGLSGVTGDVGELLRREAGEPAARLALGAFCHSARKHLAAMAASLGGLDTLVFTAGIGENSPAIRARVCEPLGFLGVRVDAARNAGNEPLISPDESPVTVRVLPTDEEAVIAGHVRRLLGGG